MKFTGTVRNGKIELPPGVSLPEGTEVAFRILNEPPAVPPATPSSPNATEEPSDGYALNRELMRFAGIVKGMPADYSINHDHYLYGTPKPE